MRGAGGVVVQREESDELDLKGRMDGLVGIACYRGAVKIDDMQGFSCFEWECNVDKVA